MNINMRTFRLIGMALFAFVLCVSFIACSDDDKDVNSNSLEGTWGLTHIITETGEEYEYDPFNPTPNTDDELKVVFKKKSDNSYTMELYNPSDSGNWELIENITGVLNQNTFTYSLEGETPRTLIIQELTANQLKVKGEIFAPNEIYTFIRME